MELERGQSDTDLKEWGSDLVRLLVEATVAWRVDRKGGKDETRVDA